jgi:hypothetical protein
MYRPHPNPYVRARPELPWRPPREDDERSREISTRLWDLRAIRAIAEAQLAQEHESLIIPVTVDCIKDLQKFTFDSQDIAAYILKLNDSHYDKSAWCKKSAQPGVTISEAALWCPCDSFVLALRESSPSGFLASVTYYIKLCLSPANKSVLLVSFHL